MRELLGLEPGQRAAGVYLVQQLMGISTDEAVRMKPSQHKWIEHTWPLIDVGMSRQDCLSWWSARYDRPLEKSACIGCPFHSDGAWRDMKLNDPESWRDAVEFDHAIRAGGGLRGYESAEQFLHRSCTPLDEVDFRNLEDMGQLNMFNNECEGMCGV